jgi:hypothetical protein
VLKRSSSQLYLIVPQKRGAPQLDDMEIVDSLEKATRLVPSTKPKQPKKEIKDSPDLPFLRLMRDTSSKLQIFKSFDPVISFLRNPMFQFVQTIEPALNKVAQLKQETSKKKIYSFDIAHCGAIDKSIRQTLNRMDAATHFPRHAVIGLIAAYDIIIHKLIQTGIQAQTKIPFGLDKTITLRDLQSFSTIEEAAHHLIRREIDSILEGGHLEQLKELNRLFAISINTDDPCIRDFLEVCERRNLFAHTAGRVSQRYLSRCRKFGIDVRGIKVGTRLDADSKYYGRAVLLIDELCTKLIQYVWRKLLPSQREVADAELNLHANDLILDEEYSLAERILDYGINHTGRSKDRDHRMMVVNYANAIKLGGDKDRAIKELHKLDWSASNSAFRISVAAIEDNLPEILRLMPNAIRNKAISKDDFRGSPVFGPAREDLAFQAAFKKHFREELVVVPRQATKSTNDPIGRDEGDRT